MMKSADKDSGLKHHLWYFATGQLPVWLNVHQQEMHHTHSRVLRC